MLDLKNHILYTTVERGVLAVFWLGQAGFIIKTSDGKLIIVDPYLSNCCERYSGYTRITPPLLAASDLCFDAMLITHAHYDHFDTDSVPLLLSNARTRLIAARDVQPEAERLHLRAERIEYLGANEQTSLGWLDVLAVPCDHGPRCRDAIGLLLNVEGKRIYITGDTCRRDDYFATETVQAPNLLILPINGKFGNMNEAQAACAARIIRPKRVVPSHFWMFVEHGGDPAAFVDAMRDVAPDVPCKVMQMGGCLRI